MEENIIDKLVNERYSIKQMIGYFIIGYNDTTDKENFNKILENIITTIIKVNKNKILDKIDVKLIENIEIYWNLTIEQVLCYGYIVFEYLMNSTQKISIKDIVNEFNIISKIYSPDNAIEYVNKKQKRIGG